MNYVYIRTQQFWLPSNPSNVLAMLYQVMDDLVLVRLRPCPNPQGLWVRPKAVGMARSFHPWASWGAAVATAVGEDSILVWDKPMESMESCGQLTPGHLSHSGSWRHWCDLGEGQLRIASNCIELPILRWQCCGLGRIASVMFAGLLCVPGLWQR